MAAKCAIERGLDRRYISCKTVGWGLEGGRKGVARIAVS